MKYYTTYQTSIGSITIVEQQNNIIGVLFGQVKPQNAIMQETELLKKTYSQIREYLEGNRTEFTIPIAMEGTCFQRQVWKALQTISYGETKTYQQIAEQIGKPKACRAVGMANHVNPISIIVPCHRVIGKNGKLVGYGGGLEIKKQLLDLEANRKDKSIE